MPQPKKEINWDKLDALLQFKISLNYCADYLEVSEDTVRRRIKEKFNLTFTEYHNLKMQRTAVKLQQKAIEYALGGDRTLMIFCLKNMAGWADKNETTHEAGKTLKLNYSLESK